MLTFVGIHERYMKWILVFFLYSPVRTFSLGAFSVMDLVLQVSGDMLVEALIELFSDAKLLETRRAAAKQAYHALSIGVVENMWRLVQFHILDKSVPM
mgnify:CR=1 FL=1